jgi:3-hydroxyisobutyrate dehydrogenase
LPTSPQPAITPPAAVAVIGLGNMGVPMGACLVKAGYAVTGFDLRAAALGNFAAAGGRIADDVAGAVVGAEAVIMLLPDGRTVRQAADAMRSHLRPASSWWR